MMFVPLLVCLLTLALKIQLAGSGSKTVLLVDPLTIDVLVGYTFTVNVTVVDVADLFGFEFYLAYNTTFQML